VCAVLTLLIGEVLNHGPEITVGVLEELADSVICLRHVAFIPVGIVWLPDGRERRLG
jgi:hypothetical protein